MRYLKLSLYVGFILILIFLALLFRPEWESWLRNDYSPGRIPIAILGDSDSHSYRDSYRGVRRGGIYHDVTYQWTEILERLRQSEVDLGQFGYWGTRGTFYRIRSLLGLSTRMPRKQDYEYNFAFSGATCNMLSPNSYQKQSYFGSRLISKDPRYWQNGIVIIRIGINDIGQWAKLESYKNGIVTSEIRKPIDNCIKQIRDATQLIRKQSSLVKIVLVGIMDNSNWPLGAITDSISHDYINKILDIYDHGLKSLADADANMLFIDDRKWYEQILGFWKSGKYIGERTISLGGKSTITNTKGDDPHNIVLSDNHAGTVANALWINNVIHHINDYFGLGLTPLSYSEIADLVDPDGRLGIAPNKRIMPTKQ